MQQEIHFQSNGTSEYLLKRLSPAWIELSSGNRRLCSILVQQDNRIMPFQVIPTQRHEEWKRITISWSLQWRFRVGILFNLNNLGLFDAESIRPHLPGIQIDFRRNREPRAITIGCFCSRIPECVVEDRHCLDARISRETHNARGIHGFRNRFGIHTTKMLRVNTSVAMRPIKRYYQKQPKILTPIDGLWKYDQSFGKE